MTCPAASLLVRFSVRDRTLVREVLAGLPAGAGSELVLRRGRIAADEARMEVEVRRGRGALESALRFLARPGFTLHSFSALDPESAPATPDLPLPVGVPTLPPESSPRSGVAGPAR